MEQTLNILIIEDSQADFVLVERHLRQQGLQADCVRVDSTRDLGRALDTGIWDLILTDYSIPKMDFYKSFAYLLSRVPELPVILVSGSVGEEQAVELLKLGICDFVLKDNLTRLVPAIERSLRELQDRKARLAAEESMRENEYRFRSIFNNSPIAIGIGRKDDGRIVEVNDAWLQLYGFERDEVIGRTATELNLYVRADERDEFIRIIGDYGRVINREVQLRRKVGDIIDVQYSAEIIRLGDESYLQVMMTDITEQKRMETELRRSEEMYRSLFGNMMNGFAYCRMLFDGDTPLDFIYLSVNDAFEKQTGLKDVTGRRVTEVIPGIRQSDPGLFEIYGRVALTGKPEHFEVYVEALEQWYWVSVYSPAKEHFVAVFDVITERKLAEQALRESEQFNKQIINNAEEGIVVYGTDLRYRGWNPYMERMSGLTAQEVIGKHPLELFPFLKDGGVIERLGKILEGQPVSSTEFPFHSLYNGYTGWASDTCSPLKNANGEITGVIGVVRDITDRKQAEDALQRYKLLSFSSRDIILFIRRDNGRILEANAAAVSTYGYSHEELLALSVSDLRAPDTLALTPVEMAEADERGILFETVHIRKDGSTFPVEVSSQGATIAGSRILVSVIRDITTRKQVEQTLRESEERYRELVQNANSVIIRWKSDGTMVFFNEYAQTYFGYRPDEVIGKHVGMLLPKQESTGTDLSGLIMDIVAHPNRYMHNDNENICRDGRRVWMTWTNKPIFDGNGKVDEILAVGSDITERKLAESKVRESEERYRSLVESAPMAIFINRNNRIEYANPAAVRLFGAGSNGNVIGRSPFDFVHPNFHAAMTERIRIILHGGSVPLVETRILQAGGIERIVEVVAATFADQQGIAIQVMMYDITERKLAEERIQRHIAVMDGINGIFQQAMLSRTEEELGERSLAVAEEITGSSFGFIGEIGPDGCLHDIAISNPGWDTCTMLDQSGHRRTPGKFKLNGIFGRVLQDNKGFFTNDPANHPDSIGLPPGHPQLKTFLGVPLLREGRVCGMIAVGNREGGYSQNELEALQALAPVVVEVFLRKKAEVALKEREVRLMRAEEMAHLGHWRYDLATEAISWSDEMYRIFGLNREEGLFGPTTEEIRKYCHPEDMDNCARSFEPAGQFDGSTLEYRIIRPSGEERHVVSNGEVEQNENAVPLALFGTLLDTTELRQKERELQEKNAEMERFTYMISHDLKSPLVTVKTFLGYLEQDMANSDAVRIGKDLDFIRTAADRMGRMLDELLELSRVGRMVNAPQNCTLHEMAESARNMVAGQIADRGVEVLVGDVDVAFFGDRPRLLEIWQNLVENACKFMGNQAHPRIEIGADRHGGDTVFFVRDNGVGIEPKYQDKVFGLFEKLDRDSEGTGLGLALVRRIVELHGGKIRVESQGRGQGACFRFTLPGALMGSAKEKAV